MARVLVTGVSGFVGKHLVRELKTRSHTVSGVGLSEQPDPTIADQLEAYTACDLSDPTQVAGLALDDIDCVASLAGLAQVGSSFDNPQAYKKINVDVLIVLANRILSEKRPIKILAVSTGAVYNSNQELPLTEISALTDNGSPYAQSKILMEQAAQQLRAGGLDCVVARPFNHIGPGQERGFIVPDLLEKIGKALTDGSEVHVGNLDTKRDYTDVRDVVKAYADMIEASSLEYDVFNICSGRSLSGQQILDRLLEVLGAKNKVEIKIDPRLIRPNDPSDLYGSNLRLAKATGWRPTIKIDQTIRDTVDFAIN